MSNTRKTTNNHALNGEPYGKAEKRVYAHVAMSAEQSEKLEYMMIGTGMNRSQYIRSILFDNNICLEKLFRPEKRSYNRGRHRVVVHFILTVAEKEALQKQCDLKGVSESQYIRFALFGNV